MEENLLAEAGTGTGKSLAYLLPALASGKRVVVATATKALQEQPRRRTSQPLPGRSDGRSTSPFSRAARTISAVAASTASTSSVACSAPTRTPRVRASARVDRDHRDGDRAELDFEPSTTLWPSSRWEPTAGAAVQSARRRSAGGRRRAWLSRTMLFTSPTSPRSHGRRRDPGRTTTRRLRRGPPARGGSLVVRRADLTGSFRQLARDVERYCREQSAPARARRAGPRRSGADRRLRPGRRPAPAGRGRPRRPGSPRTRSRGGADAARGRARGRGEGRRTRWPAVRSRRSPTWRPASRSGIPIGSHGRSPRRSPGHPWTSPRSCARRFGRGPTAVLVSATLEARFLRDRLGLDEAREVILPRRSTTASRHWCTCPRASRSRARRVPRTAGRRGRRALPPLARPCARPHVVLSRSARSWSAPARGVLPRACPGRRAARAPPGAVS